MKALLVTWLGEGAAFLLTTTHILSSWNIVFTEVPVTESVDDVDLTSVLGGGPSLGTRVHKMKALTINQNPHLDCLPAIHKQTYNLCRLT